MSLSRALRPIAIAGMLTLSAALGACSFAPVYSSGSLASQPLLNLAFAKPNSRLEQVVYQELALRFGHSEAPTAPLAQVFVSASASDSVLSRTANPAKPMEVTATATLTITYRDDSGKQPIRLTRFATAGYSRSGQVLADKEAEREAAERAAKAAAESLRLGLLATLSR
ncbi:hypothetical protein GCM10007913_41580 [Devosia yakushimensis]|uniref:LPS-assembly lipoprotein n=2 Tax=Devosia yakushimensis TaxID=470028 RepID=A0ABQ5UJE3_9HYPH|nr:hypothetical protein GCM10007913_41580 [Devosia yakushimensis]